MSRSAAKSPHSAASGGVAAFDPLTLAPPPFVIARTAATRALRRAVAARSRRPARRARIGRRTPWLLLGLLRRFGAGDLEQAVEFFLGHLLQHAEVRARQRRAFIVEQQPGPVAALLVFELAARLQADAAPRQLVDRDLAVLVADLAAGLAVQVEALAAAGHRQQVRGAAGVAAEERRQHLLAEHARRARLDVDVGAQLQRLRRAVEQRREALAQLLRAGRGA